MSSSKSYKKSNKRPIDKNSLNSVKINLDRNITTAHSNNISKSCLKSYKKTNIHSYPRAKSVGFIVDSLRYNTPS